VYKGPDQEHKRRLDAKLKLLGEGKLPGEGAVTRPVSPASLAVSASEHASHHAGRVDMRHGGDGGSGDRQPSSWMSSSSSSFVSTLPSSSSSSSSASAAASASSSTAAPSARPPAAAAAAPSSSSASGKAGQGGENGDDGSDDEEGNEREPLPDCVDPNYHRVDLGGKAAAPA
jgi:hypothetical protein